MPLETLVGLAEGKTVTVKNIGSIAGSYIRHVSSMWEPQMDLESFTSYIFTPCEHPQAADTYRLDMKYFPWSSAGSASLFAVIKRTGESLRSMQLM